MEFAVLKKVPDRKFVFHTFVFRLAEMVKLFLSSGPMRDGSYSTNIFCCPAFFSSKAMVNLSEISLTCMKY